MTRILVPDTGTPVALAAANDALARKDYAEALSAAIEKTDTRAGGLLAVLDGLPAAERATWLIIVCSDHGTLYGEDGYVGHRIAHPIVTNVPYAEILA